MTDADMDVSRRTLNRTLFNLGHVDQIPASDEQLRLALLKALRPIVGGSDGVWAALHVLCSEGTTHDRRSVKHAG